MVFPPGDKEAVEVTAGDLARLDPGEFLNDTVIDYYIKCASKKSLIMTLTLTPSLEALSSTITSSAPGMTAKTCSA